MRFSAELSRLLATSPASHGGGQQHSSSAKPSSSRISNRSRSGMRLALMATLCLMATYATNVLAVAIIKRVNMYLVGAGITGLGSVTATACKAPLPFTPQVQAAACAISLAVSLGGSLYALIAGATSNAAVEGFQVHSHVANACNGFVHPSTGSTRMLHCLEGLHTGEPMHFGNRTVGPTVYDLWYHKQGNRHLLSTNEQKQSVLGKRREDEVGEESGSGVNMGIAFDDDNVGDEQAIANSHSGLEDAMAHFMDSEDHAQQFQQCVSYHDNDDNQNVAFRGEMIMSTGGIFNQPGESQAEANTCNSMDF